MMRRSIDDDLPITTNVQVTVWLRNKYRLRGVVKGGTFVEKVDGLDFIQADTKTPGAGIRVWYYDNTNSYIFLPFEGIARYKIGARLTEVQIEKIEQRIEERRRSADEKRKAAQVRLKARQGLEGEKVGGNGETEPARGKSDKEEARLLSLLKEYPPDDGWGPEKIKEIERRKLVIGAFPDDESRRFMEIFEDWMKAVELKEKLDAEKAQGGTEKAPEKTGEKTEEKPAELTEKQKAEAARRSRYGPRGSGRQ